MWRNNEEHDEEFMRPFDTSYVIFQKQKEYEDAASMMSLVLRREVRMREYG